MSGRVVTTRDMVVCRECNHFAFVHGISDENHTPCACCEAANMKMGEVED